MRVTNCAFICTSCVLLPKCSSLHFDSNEDLTTVLHSSTRIGYLYATGRWSQTSLNFGGTLTTDFSTGMQHHPRVYHAKSWWNLSKTSLSVHHNLSRQHYGKEILCVQPDIRYDDCREPHYDLRGRPFREVLRNANFT
jgi:hypothetical protein